MSTRIIVGNVTTDAQNARRVRIRARRIRTIKAHVAATMLFSSAFPARPVVIDFYLGQLGYVIFRRI